jgi:hypothetical protein
VTGAAGGIDEADFPEAEGLDSRGEGPVENELLDKVRGLEKGVALAGGFREVLVKITEEAGIPLGIGEVVNELARLFIMLAPEEDELTAENTIGPELPERVVFFIKEVPETGEGGEFFEVILEVVALLLKRVFAKVEDLLVIGFLKSFPRTGELGRSDEFLILQKACEDTGENPGDRNLRALAGEPFIESEGGSFTFFGLLVSFVEWGPKFRCLFAPGKEVVFDSLDPGNERSFES